MLARRWFQKRPSLRFRNKRPHTPNPLNYVIFVGIVHHGPRKNLLYPCPFSTYRKYAYPGDYILVSVKQLRLVRKVKVGQIHLALVTRTRKRVAFKDGTYSRSQKNIVLIINQKKRILSTRIFGWVSRKLRRKKFLRILIICGRYII